MHDDIGTEKEHLDWAKQRAKEYTDEGDVSNAWASFVSDLSKHSGTRNHPAIDLGMMLLMSGHLSTPKAMWEFIDGFN